MRKTLAAAALLVLAAGYAAAGYWIAPGYVREALAERAASRGLALELATVHTRPFALRIELAGIALRDSQGRVFAEAESAVADLGWESLWRRGWIIEELRLRAPSVTLGAMPAVASEGEAGASAALTVRDLVIEEGRLRYAGHAIEALSLRARGLSTLGAVAGRYEAAARLAGGGEITSSGTLSLAPFAAEGALSAGALRAARLLPGAQGELDGSARYAYAEGRLDLREVSLAGNGLGRISAQGSVALAPLRAELRVAAQALPLALAQRWLPQGVAARVVSGTLAGSGRVRIGDGSAAYQGSAAIDGLRLEERDSEALLLAWERAGTESLELGLSPFSLAIGELAVRAPEGRLVIASDGSVNFAALFPHGGDDRAPAHAAVERLRIEKGTLHFADRSLDNPFEVTLRELSGSITSVGNASDEPARIRLAGRVQPYGSARIRGTIDLDAPTQLADIRADLRNLRLEAFNPYIAKFAGYRIESGRVSADLRYELRDGRLVGTNQLVVENMKLGEKLEEKGLLDLPLDLAVALLTDSEGRIDLDIPVRGSLNDPQFDLGAIIARAFGNVLKKIVSAPFRALAGLLGGEDDDAPGSVAFAPGSSMLSPPAEESLARVAEGLRQRPQLGVEVHGGYDPAGDLEALRLRAARQDIAREAGVRGPLDLANPRAAQAAERLYLRRGGDRGTLRALRETEERYARALLQKLAAAIPVDGAAMQALARERAEAVRAALADHGADPARVMIGEPAASPSGEEGIMTVLSLSTVGAAAGATAAAKPAPRR
jgi:hypothetical protein